MTVPRSVVTGRRIALALLLFALTITVLLTLVLIGWLVTRPTVL